jgi:hypothetical protein
MNIFILDQDIEKCAEYHIDAHSGKMQLDALHYSLDRQVRRIHSS